jgi:hypothetical protein
MMRWASLTLLFLLAFTVPVNGQSAHDSQTIRDVIEAQWNAFLADDAEKAFSLASPEVRESFGTASNFMKTVRKDYPMVYHHASSQFLDQEIHAQFSFQLVQLSQGDGQVWLVVYQMQRQDDGRWLIGGVVAVPKGEKPVLQPPADST